MHKTLPLGVVICLALSIHARAELAPASPSGKEGRSTPRTQDQTAHDLTLFRGDLTPEAGMGCTHLLGTPGGHGASIVGLTTSALFAEPHDCGGFHGNGMMAAVVLNDVVPIELLSWRARSPLRLASR